jgi:ATP-binding cassette subfamily F protein 3
VKERVSSAPANDYKEKKVLQNRLKKLEQMMEQYQKDMKYLDEQLADASLYEDKSQQNKLNQLIQKRDVAHTSLNQAEEEWVEIGSSLED